MDRQRTDLGFADSIDDFDPSEWLPQPVVTANDKPPQAETKKAAAAAGFRSREPQPAVEARPAELPRRRPHRAQHAAQSESPARNNRRVLRHRGRPRLGSRRDA